MNKIVYLFHLLVNSGPLESPETVINLLNKSGREYNLLSTYHLLKTIDYHTTQSCTVQGIRAGHQTGPLGLGRKV